MMPWSVVSLEDGWIFTTVIRLESGFSQFDQKIEEIMFNLNPSFYLIKHQWAQIKTHKSMFFIESFPPFTFFLLRLVCFLLYDAALLGNPED
jgi:hypothetical protein